MISKWMIATNNEGKLLEFEKFFEGKALLESVDFSAFTSAEDQDWDDVRSLKLGSLTKPLGEK